MEYAIIETGGKQYKAYVGRQLEVERLDTVADAEYIFNNVLLYASEGVCEIGRPFLKGVTVSGKVIEQMKGDKIRVAKFKAKARYRRVNGHRQSMTKIQITGISAKKTVTPSEKIEKKESAIKAKPEAKTEKKA